jgi:hypothetical protein
MKTQKTSPAKTKAIPPLALAQPDAAGIDIGATELWVAVPAERSAQPVRRFGAFTKDLEALVQHLKACGIGSVAMESTGLYWIPLYQLLAEAGFKVCLVNARHVKNVPGRKSDVRDCQWLQYLHSVGLLQASYRPQQAVLRGALALPLPPEPGSFERPARPTHARGFGPNEPQAALCHR